MIDLTVREKKWNFFFFLPFYFIFARYVLSFLFLLLLRITHLQMSAVLLDPWFNFFYDFILLLIGCICFRQYLKKSVRALSGHWLRTIAWSLTIGFAILYLANIISGIMVSMIDGSASSTNQDTIVMLAQLAPFPMIVSSVVFAPVLEEMVFRVGIFQAFYTHRGLAYLLSSLAFGLVHIISGLGSGDWSQLLFLIPYSLLGAVFAYLYEKKQSIFVPIMVHAANNLLSMIVIFLY